MNRYIYAISIFIKDIKKITVDKSVRYVPITEKTKAREIKPETIKTGSIPRKQNKNISQNSKNFPKIVAASGFATLTK